MNFYKTILLAFIYTLVLTTPALFAGELHYLEKWESDGEVSFQYRSFEDDENVVTHDSGQAVFAEIGSKYNGTYVDMNLRGFAVTDERDETRSIVEIREAYLSHSNDSVEIKAGFQIFNWSTMESFHPIDILNSPNLDPFNDKSDKIGESSLDLTKLFDNGALAFYYFPRFEKPHHPTKSSRLGLGIDIGEPVWVDSSYIQYANSYGTQWGSRFTYNFGEADIDLNFLRRMDRHKPVLGINRIGDIHPYYFFMNQYGVAYQHSIAGMILKLEGAYRNYDEVSYSTFIPTPYGNMLRIISPTDHTEIAMGGEKSWGHLNGTDSTIYLEAQFISGCNADEREKLSVFQKDLMAGYRYAHNDTMGKEFFISGIFDMERGGELILSSNYKQRLSDLWSIKAGLIYVDAKNVEPTLENVEKLTGLRTQRDSDHIYFDISRHF